MKNPHKELSDILAGLQPEPDRIFLLTDTNVEPLIGEYRIICRQQAPTITIVIPPGEQSKTLSQASRIAETLSREGATRSSVMVNIGGGVVTDLGGFTASIFKRGIRTVNVATTLLGAVDAAIGGKTGVDFSGLKNELGTFWLPSGIVTATDLLPCQPYEVKIDGYAEMLKTAMLSDSNLYRRLLNVEDVIEDPQTLGRAAEKCAAFKKMVVETDPREQGLRRILNLGHTFGHAFESHCRKNGVDIGHGTAVAHGLLCTLILSKISSGLNSKEISRYRTMLLANYKRLPIKCTDRDSLIELIFHDKKCGRDGRPRFVTLKEIGVPIESYMATDEEIRNTIECYEWMRG
ncbi:MAG: 3-dehydroquinate synthase [Clostridium sp.]|nr:3-dehydroquinate synthase [Clostridium sp.]